MGQNYAIIEDGVCVNAIVSGPEFAEKLGAVELPEGFGIGDFYDGTEWEKAPQPEPEPQPEAPDYIEFVNGLMEGYENEQA